SRFLQEIPAELLDGSPVIESRFARSGVFAQRDNERRGFVSSAATGRAASPFARPTQPARLPNHGGGAGIDWKVGEKVKHGKWGIGTVVSVKGTGDDLELDIAFPSPTGIKKLLAKFAPIERA